MHMIRHYYVSNQRELIAVADLGQNLYESVSRALRFQEWYAVIAGEGYEMQIALPVVAL